MFQLLISQLLCSALLLAKEFKWKTTNKFQLLFCSVADNSATPHCDATGQRALGTLQPFPLKSQKFH